MKASAITWLDHSEADQRRMREVLRLFESRGTVDDLGVGTIRDSISNTLFPGTSIIQTRARYFLFIPWIFREAERINSSQVVAKAGDLERKLIAPLKASDDPEGLIGREAGVNVRTLPSSIYWSGLTNYRIFRAPGLTINQYGRAIASGRTAADFEDELGEREETFWNTEIPSPPDDFFKFNDASFALTNDEAEWLCNRIVANKSAQGERSLLAAFIGDARRAQAPAGASAAWECQIPQTAPAPAIELLHQARHFSLAIEGAALLYNLMLANTRLDRGLKPTADTAPETYDDRLEDWSARADNHTLSAWAADIEAFWSALPHQGSSIPAETKTFVNSWAHEIAANGTAVTSSESAKALIIERERFHKKSQARFHNSARLEAWAGDAGTSPMTYRWPQVQRMLGDIASGMATID